MSTSQTQVKETETEKAPGLWTMTKGEFEESVTSLERAIVKKGGAPRKLFDLLRTNSGFAERTAETMLRDGFDPSTEVKLARLMLGKNIFDVPDWTALYEAGFTGKQHREAAKFPWSEEVLQSPCPFVEGERVCDTHFAFLGVEQINGEPLTVAKWLQLHPKTGQPCFYFSEDPWHTGQPHTDKAELTFRWYLMLKDIVPNSTDKTPEEQVAMLPPEYEVPTTIAEVTKDILVFRKTGMPPNPSVWAACTERTVKTGKLSDDDVGDVSCVGSFDGYGLNVNLWSGSGFYSVGVGASRKS